jgi:hypothetical protein
MNEQAFMGAALSAMPIMPRMNTTRRTSVHDTNFHTIDYMLAQRLRLCIHELSC